MRLQHVIAELYDCNRTLADDELFARDVLVQAAIKANASLLDVSSHKFSPQGVTAFALLAESHISLHTWPETGMIAIDVFTCGNHTQPMDAFTYLVANYEAKHYDFQLIKRD